jgi:hypothetical protein
MLLLRFGLRSSIAFAIVGLLAACGPQGVGVQPASSLAMQGRAFPDLTPPKCKGQEDSKQFSKLKAALKTSGGAFCIPEFGGFGGKVKYPSANPSVSVTLISSTTNYDNMPELGSGSAIFYLQLAISGGTTFGTSVRAGGGLTSAEITPNDPYTIYGQADVEGIKVNFGPCYAIATSGKYGGVIGGIGTLLEGEKVPFAASGVIEVYSGQQTSKSC